MEIIKTIIQIFFPDKKGFKVHSIQGGLINLTYKISFEDGDTYILQSINKSVFKYPFDIMDNIDCIANHLKASNYPLQILEPVNSSNGLLEKDDFGNYWRAFPFIENSVVLEKVHKPSQAFEAAKSFGLFLRHLDGIEIKSIKESIPNFHNLQQRLKLFENAVQENIANRNGTAKNEIETVKKWQNRMLFDFDKLPIRIVHNDTKISNVLLDKKVGKGICVIDLDTVMPGYLINDFGDMIRTMCCTASEEETNLQKVAIDIEIFKATAAGFLSVTREILTKEEKENLINGGLYIIFEQAVRFTTDYLLGDVYYPANYEKHNLLRGRNQLKLLQSLYNQKSSLKQIVIELS